MVTLEKVKILKSILGDYYKSSDEHLFHCPFCKHHKNKLSVNVEKNVWKCWVCDASGKKVFQLVKKFGDYEHIREWLKYDKTTELTKTDVELANLFNKDTKGPAPTISLPNDFASLCNPNKSESSYRPLNYLKSRDISDDLIKKWRVGYCQNGTYEKRIIIPSFNLNGDINFFVSRTFTGDKFKYKNPKVKRTEIIFNELYIDWSKPIYLVEGVFDAMKFKSNSIPLLGSTLSKRHRLFKKIVENNCKVYIGLDQDANRKQNKIINLLSKYGIECYVINTTGFEDIAEMPDVDLTSRIINSSKTSDLDCILDKLRYLNI